MSKSAEEKMRALDVKRIEAEKVYREALDEWDEVDANVDKASKELDGILEEIKELEKTNLEQGFEVWKETNTELVNKAYDSPNRVFMISKEQELKAHYLNSVHGSKNTGATGGGVTYRFTPTSIGTIESVIIEGKEFNLTDYTTF